jgi:hypothetical protein
VNTGPGNNLNVDTLEQFRLAVEQAVADGVFPLDAWTVCRNHRIRRAVVNGLAASAG